MEGWTMLQTVLRKDSNSHPGRNEVLVCHEGGPVPLQKVPLCQRSRHRPLLPTSLPDVQGARPPTNLQSTCWVKRLSGRPAKEWDSRVFRFGRFPDRRSLIIAV